MSQVNTAGWNISDILIKGLVQIKLARSRVTRTRRLLKYLLAYPPPPLLSISAAQQTYPSGFIGLLIQTLWIR